MSSHWTKGSFGNGGDHGEQTREEIVARLLPGHRLPGT